MKIMKIILNVFLSVLLAFGGVPVQAELNQAETTDLSVKAIRYLDKYNNYRNVIGCLNSDGTETVYIFSQDASSQMIDRKVSNITGLSIPMSTRSNATDCFLVEDAVVYSDAVYAGGNYGNLSYYEVGDSNKGTARSYLRFDLSDLGISDPNNIVSAYYYMSNANTPDNVHLEAYLATSSWNESTITWNNKPDYYAGERVATISLLEHTTTDDNIDYPDELYLTKAVMAWVQGASNYGIVLKEVNDGVSEWGNVSKQIYSSENTNDSNLPYLTITYETDVLEQTPGIINGERYYVINKNSEKYLEAAATTNGSRIYQNVGNGDALQMFTFVYMENGYYAIQVGSSNAYLTAGAGSLSEVTVGTYNSTYGQWKIVRSWNGGYRIYNKAYLPYALFLPANVTSDYTTVTMKNYIQNYVFNDEWSIVPVDRGGSSIFSFTLDAAGINTSKGMNHIKSFIEADNSGFENVQQRVDQSATVAYQSITNDAIFIYSGHGNRSAFSLYNSAGNRSWLTSNNYPNTTEEHIKFNYGSNLLEENALAQQQLNIIQSCLTGCNYGNANLVGEMYRMGSHNIISNTCVTNTYMSSQASPDYQWLQSFIMNLGVSRNIGYAKSQADDLIYDWFFGDDCTVTQRHDLGDESVYLLSYPLALSGFALNLYQDRVPNISDKSGFKKIVISLGGTSQELTYICTTSGDGYGDSYDVYTDANSGLYNFYKGTSRLYSYQPYIGEMNLGEMVVDGNKAFALADDFMATLGYDVSSFECSHSTSFSKNYRIQYRYKIDGVPTSEGITFHMKAGTDGTVYLTSFVATNYGLFSTDESINPSLPSATKMLQTLRLAKEEGDGSYVKIGRIFWDKDDDTAVLKAVVKTQKNNQRCLQVFTLQ